MLLTLGQAAKEVGKSKATLSKYIKDGRLSYKDKTDKGYQIDPAELFRVFPADKHFRVYGEQSETHDKHHGNSLLEQKLESAEERIADLKAQLRKAEEREERLQQQVEKITEMADRQTRLLEAKNEKPTEKPAQRRKGLFW